MSRAYAAVSVDEMRFPRVSGDEPTDCRDLSRRTMFSPRERG